MTFFDLCPGERLVVGGIVVMLVKIRENNYAKDKDPRVVRLGFDGPREIPVVRAELFEKRLTQKGG